MAYIAAETIPPPPAAAEFKRTNSVMTSLGSNTTISASHEARKIWEQYEASKKSGLERGRSGSDAHAGSTSARPRLRPPPPTPPEHAHFPHSLSTPHLPFFHHYTDDRLLEKYQEERAKDPGSFDKQTAKIKQYLLNAKVERGGIRYLEESEYSVDLASREDARKFQEMSIQRDRIMERNIMAATHAFVESRIPTEGTAGVQEVNDDEESTAGSHLIKVASSRGPDPSPTLPKDFDFASHVAKYTTSGFVRHQHTRKVVEIPTGGEITLKTMVVIEQVIYVPNVDQLSWEDVKAASQNVQTDKNTARKLATRVNSEKKWPYDIDVPFSDSDDDAEDELVPEPVTNTTTSNTKALLDAIAAIKGTGHLSRGVSLSEYLTQIGQDIAAAACKDATGNISTKNITDTPAMTNKGKQPEIETEIEIEPEGHVTEDIHDAEYWRWIAIQAGVEVD